MLVSKSIKGKKLKTDKLENLERKSEGKINEGRRRTQKQSEGKTEEISNKLMKKNDKQRRRLKIQ